jgi:hypothetical protein
MALPKELVAAYARAEYVVFGEPSRRLDGMLAAVEGLP